MELYLPIIQTVCIVIIGYIVTYLSAKINLSKKVTTVINEAELKYKNAQNSSILKMDYAVDLLYTYVPTWLKPVLTKEVLRLLIQKTFDEVEEYVNTQLDKISAKINEKFDNK